LVDNKGTLYLTDFGLCLDKEFNLDKNEIKFMKMNKKLDIIYIYDTIYSNLHNMCWRNKNIRKKYKLDDFDNPTRLKHLIDNIDVIQKEIYFSKIYIIFIKKYYEIEFVFLSWIQKFKKSSNKETLFINKIIS